jgi:hypothetical protein
VGSGEKDKRRAGYGESGERWVERPEAKVFAKRERYKKRLYHASSPKSVAQVIHAFRKSSGHTTYLYSTSSAYLEYVYCASVTHINDKSAEMS